MIFFFVAKRTIIHCDDEFDENSSSCVSLKKKTRDKKVFFIKKLIELSLLIRKIFIHFFCTGFRVVENDKRFDIDY